MKSWLWICIWVAVSSINIVPIHASYSRVESMGKSAEFFMDDVSIFDNPANMNIFPNFLIGELGTYRFAPGQADSSALVRANRDPENSWFGGIFSYSSGGKKNKKKLSPQFSIGGAFNRLDGEILPLAPDSADGKVIPQPATNFDGFLGIALARGGMLGSHIYTAVQEGAELVGGNVQSADGDIRISLLRADLGINWPLGKSVDGELSVGGARTSYGPDSINAKWSFFAKARAFSTVEVINGEVVPILNYSRIAIPGRVASLLHFGVGANVSMDRGFFWLGIQGIFDEWKTSGMDTSGGHLVYRSSSGLKTSETRRGVSVGFGIERNIWWEWLVLRVGGHKEIAFTNVKDGTSNYSYVRTNATGDMTVGDQVGFGIGLNVEEKLKLDATLAEDLPYTFGNLFSGPHHHVISRISATYSF